MSQSSNNQGRKRHRQKKSEVSDLNRSSSTSPPYKMAAITGSGEILSQIDSKKIVTDNLTVVNDFTNREEDNVKLDLVSDGDKGDLTPPQDETFFDTSQDISQLSVGSADTGIQSDDSVLTVINAEDNDILLANGRDGQNESGDHKDEDKVKNRSIGRGGRRNRSNSLPDAIIGSQIGEWCSGRVTRSQTSAKDNYIVQAITREIFELKTDMMSEMSKENKKLGEKINSMERKMLKLNTETVLRLGTVEASVKSMEARHTELEKKQSELDGIIDTKVKAINVRFEEQQQAITKVKKSVSDWNKKEKERDDSVKKVNDDYRQINNKLNVNGNRINQVNDNLEKYKLEQSTVKAGIDEKIRKAELNIESQKKDLNLIKQDMSKIKAKVLKPGPGTDSDPGEGQAGFGFVGDHVGAQSIDMVSKQELDAERNKVKEMEERLNDMEKKLKATIPAPCDDVPKCLIAYNIHYQEGENLLAKCTRLIGYIHPQALPVVDCKRIGKGSVENPPMCKIALSDVSKKVLVLQNRQIIRDCAEFSHVTMRPSRDHLERQMRKNFATLTKSVPGINNRFRMTSHSLLVDRDRSGEREGDGYDGEDDGDTLPINRGRGDRGNGQGRRGNSRGRVGRGGRGRYTRGRGSRGQGRPRSDRGGRGVTNSGSSEYQYSDSEFPGLNSNHGINNNNNNISNEH